MDVTHLCMNLISKNLIKFDISYYWYKYTEITMI